MILKKDLVVRLADFVGVIRTDNYYRFKNENSVLVIYGMDNFSFFKIETDVSWDLEGIEYFNINLPNLSFIDNEILITADSDYVYMTYQYNGLDTKIKLLRLYEDLYPNFNFEVSKSVDITVNYSYYVELFKRLLKHTNPNSDDFTSCVYLDKNNMFSTDKHSSCWILNEDILIDTDKLLVDTKFINLFSRFTGFKKLDLIYSETKIGFIVEYDFFKISYLTSTLFLNYPDFKTLFDKFDFIDFVKFSSKDVMSVLTSINKFDGKCDKIKITINPESLFVNFAEQSLDNSKFINLNVMLDESNFSFDTNFELFINPHLLLKSIQDSPFFTLWFNYTKKQPVMITTEDTNIRRYIQTYYA